MDGARVCMRLCITEMACMQFTPGVPQLSPIGMKSLGPYYLTFLGFIKTTAKLPCWGNLTCGHNHACEALTNATQACTGLHVIGHRGPYVVICSRCGSGAGAQARP